MYFPKGFERERAVEEGELVQQAYRQLDAFKSGAEWKLDGGYSLVTELLYPAPAKILRGGSSFDYELQKLSRAGMRRGRGLPIGFIARRSADFHVVFRGTVTVEEWIRNLNFTLAPYLLPGFGKVHEGFLQTYLLVRQSILEALAAEKEGRRLFVTGHSLGGALATLAAADIARAAAPRAPLIYTFGSPRVGDKDFAQSYNRAHGPASFRVVNTSDIVVAIPLPVPFAGVFGGFFTHVETPVDFTAQEESLEKNHLMDTYLAALSGVRPRPRLIGALLRQAR